VSAPAADTPATSVRRLVGLQVADPPEVWTTLGFHVVDGRVAIGGVELELATGESGGGVRGWRFDPPWAAPIDGLAPLPTRTDRPAARASAATGTSQALAPAAHPNGTTALDHVVVTSPDVERTTAALVEAGIVPRRTVEGARGDHDVLYRFFLLGTCVLELIGPRTPDGEGPARFVGLAFTTTGLDDLGAIAGDPRPAVQAGRRIATVRKQAGSSVPIAFLSPRS
jgi:hypothetical protein